MKIKITSDSTCDLSQDILDRYNITIVPLKIYKGDQICTDGVDIFPQDIFEFVESGKGICQTCAINVSDYIEVWKQFADDYDAIIHFDISSYASSCNQNANIAANDEFNNVYVIDSLALSQAQGLAIIEAAEMAEAGMDAKDIVDKLNNEIIPKMETSFIINTLLYLQKGGRCSTLTALGANLLKLKPCIEMPNGQMQVGKKYRGNMDKCGSQYIRDRLEGRTDIDLKRASLTRTYGTPEDVFQKWKKEVLELQPFEELIEGMAGCTISNHSGPYTMGILFKRK